MRRDEEVWNGKGDAALEALLRENLVHKPSRLHGRGARRHDIQMGQFRELSDSWALRTKRVATSDDTSELLLEELLCINCHTVTNYPRQGDDRHIHQFRVVGGPDGTGVPGALCSACHQEDNQPSSGVPGAPNWRLAPAKMAFERAPGVAMEGKALCERLLDKKRNGNLGLRGLELHLARESLVLWAWSPGTSKDGSPRLTPPVSQEELVAAFKAWAATGAPCPK